MILQHFWVWSGSMFRVVLDIMRTDAWVFRVSSAVTTVTCNILGCSELCARRLAAKQGAFMHADAHTVLLTSTAACLWGCCLLLVQNC